jgi:hypothetical protein
MQAGLRSSQHLESETRPRRESPAAIQPQKSCFSRMLWSLVRSFALPKNYLHTLRNRGGQALTKHEIDIADLDEAANRSIAMK